MTNWSEQLRNKIQCIVFELTTAEFQENLPQKLYYRGPEPGSSGRGVNTEKKVFVTVRHRKLKR